MFWTPVEWYFVLWEFLNWLCKLWQSHRDFWQIIDHSNEWLTSFLQVGAGISVIGDSLLWADLHPFVVHVSPKKSTSIFLYCSLSKFNLTLLFLAVSIKVVNATSWSLWFCCLPTIIVSSAMTMTCLIIPKYWLSLHWNTSPTTVVPNGMTVYLNLSIPMLKVVKNDEASSSFWC